MPTLWIFNHYAGYPENVPATRTFELSRHLASKGWDVVVIACSFNHYTFTDDFPENTSAVTETVRDDVRWIFVKGSPYRGNGRRRLRNMLDYSARAYRWSRSQPPPDCVIGTTVHPFAADVARRAAHRHRVPFVYEITDLWPESLVDLQHIQRSSPVYRLMRRIEAHAFRDAAGVIGIPPLVDVYARDAYGLKLENFIAIPNGTIRPTAIECTKNAPVERGTIAYAGGFAPAHGLTTLIDAAAILHARDPGRFTFHLYGDGPERFAVEARAAQLGIPNVIFHGLVAKASLNDKLSQAEICLCTGEVLPVHRYGVSFNKIFDYFKAARPIVYAVDGGNDPVAEAGAGLSVAAGDEAGIALAVQRLADMAPGDLAAMGGRGREFLAEEHSFDVLGVRLERFLLDLVANDKQPRRAT